MDLGTLATPRPTQAASVDTGWYLTGCVEPGRSICKFPINSESFVIGRRPGVSLTLPSGRVSGRHAEIIIVGEHLFIRDLGSTNGTFVNRRKVVRPTPIGEGDHIELADTEFRLEYLPRKPIDPDVGSISRSTHRPTVVLPEPLSPTRASASPRSMWKETPLTAFTARPWLKGKCLTSDCTSRTGAPVTARPAHS